MLPISNRFVGPGNELELNLDNWQTKDLVSTLVPDATSKILSPIGVINRRVDTAMSTALPKGWQGPTTSTVFNNTNKTGPYPYEAEFYHNFLAEFTITGWIYSASTYAGLNYYVALSRGGLFTNNTNFAFGLRRRTSPTTGNVAFCYRYNGATPGGGEWKSGVIMADDQWQFIAVSWLSGRQIFYTGDPSATVSSRSLRQVHSSTSTNGTDGAQPVYYGRGISHPSTSYPFVGYLSDLRLYRRAMLVDEIEDIYERWYDAYKPVSTKVYFLPTVAPPASTFRGLSLLGVGT
ncbi:hypothetical protein KC963_00095 [Candidatus Saccharibacteria bacterium]|nr:hypothetical protein [Candidatus Saccharibacteria bacterium]